MWCGHAANAYSIVQVVTGPEGNELIVETRAFINGGSDNKLSQHISATLKEASSVWEEVVISSSPVGRRDGDSGACWLWICSHLRGCQIVESTIVGAWLGGFVTECAS